MVQDGPYSYGSHLLHAGKLDCRRYDTQAVQEPPNSGAANGNSQSHTGAPSLPVVQEPCPPHTLSAVPLKPGQGRHCGPAWPSTHSEQSSPWKLGAHCAQAGGANPASHLHAGVPNMVELQDPWPWLKGRHGGHHNKVHEHPFSHTANNQTVNHLAHQGAPTETDTWSSLHIATPGTYQYDPSVALKPSHVALHHGPVRPA